MASPTPTAMQQPRSPPVPNQPLQGLPSISSLTNSLPPSSHSPDPTSASDTTRDSGTWPGSQQSKHNSANSGLQVHTLLNPDDSPSRSSIPSTPLSSRIPNSAPCTNAILPSINQAFRDTNNRDSRDSVALSMESRRSSVDSRMHQSMNNLYIHNNNPTSPYESANGSQVSLAASLRRPNGAAPLSPLSGRAGVSRSAAPRIAPPIIGPGRMPGQPDPTAATPTQGYAWAFPDSAIPEEGPGSDSGDSSVGISRQNSYTASSMRSSIFSNDSIMPPGQRRFEEDHPTTHHHTMQHRTIQSLQNEHSAQGGVGNYSRTPELRVSHKLAERKRRSEMKDLFEDLNKAVPSNGGAKASKWEILTKAIDYIRSTQIAERQMHNELQRLQRESEYAREAHQENEKLKLEVQLMQQNLRRLDPSAPHLYGQYTSQLSQQPQAPPPQSQPSHPPQTNGNSMSLPPIQSSDGGPVRENRSSHGNGPTPAFGPTNGPPPGAMQGVEYGGYGR